MTVSYRYDLLLDHGKVLDGSHNHDQTVEAATNLPAESQAVKPEGTALDDRDEVHRVCRWRVAAR